MNFILYLSLNRRVKRMAKTFIYLPDWIGSHASYRAISINPNLDPQHENRTIYRHVEELQYCSLIG